MSDPHSGHDHHHHPISAQGDRRLLWLALLLLLAFMAVEVVIGILASSLALITDAGHMLTDAAAIALALFAMHLAARPAHGDFTWGYKRVEILSAQANGITLLLLALWFVVEGIRRLLQPPEVEGLAVFLTALAGIAVNLVAVWLLARADRRSLNIEGSYQHILTDLYAFIATAIAGALIWLTGWYRLDAVAALVVAGLMLRAGYGLVRESGRVFLEAAPRGTDPEAVLAAMLAEPEVTHVADLHVWEVTSRMPALSAHVFVNPGADCHGTRRRVAAMLGERFGIHHVTLQTDHGTAPADPAADANCAHCGS